MPDDAATLFDTVAKDSLEPSIPADTTKEPDLSTTVQATADKEAAELGQILIASGFTKDNLNIALEAPQALSAMRGMIENNPQEFLNMLERTNPDAAKNFHEKMADLYVERYADKAPANGSSKSADSELMREVQVLRSETQALKSEREQERTQAAMAQVQNRYNGRVDDLFNLDGVKKLELTKSEQKALRSDLSAELAKDPAVVRRISNGNFVDVPKTFQGIIESWAADKKAQAETAKNQRERSNTSAFPDFPSGPNPLMVDVPQETFDSWDKTEEALGAALARMR